MSDVLADITRSGLCHGCGACAARLHGKIKMHMTQEGYLRPRATTALSGADEASVVEVCSGLSLMGSAGMAGHYHPVWGPLASVGTGHATAPDIRYRGSSGGVISAIALYLVEQGLVDFVLQTAADPNDPIGNVSRLSDSRMSILAAAGSRYAPSSPLAYLEDYLSAGRKFAFIGKPCDVASLRRLAVSDARIDRLIPVKLAFFCAGVPSRKGALALLDELQVNEAELTEFSYRGRGWPGRTRAVRRDGSEASMDYNSAWGAILNRHLQFRCKICPDGTGEAADIACADAWYGKDGYPDFSETDGRSLIICRTETGRSLLADAIAHGDIQQDPLDVSEIAQMQPYQVERKRSVLARLLGMALKGCRLPGYSRLSLWRLALTSNPITQLRNVWGTYRRIERSNNGRY